MPFTDNYKLWSGTPGNFLDALEDSRRMLTIDRQLLGLFEVFGNGVISGFNVVSSGTLTVSVLPGTAHINFLAVSTTDPVSVGPLVPNSNNYIYAQSLNDTRYTRQAHFFSDLVNFNSGNMILLATVLTGPTAIISIDLTRDDISFISTIQSFIKTHKHTGTITSPSKIDLSSEVSGVLPGFRINDIDASKITSGLINPTRFPRLDHSDLANSGVLSHAQLDSFVRNLSNSNTRLMGELTTINFLNMCLAVKHIWSDVDTYNTNMLTMIPGISKDSFIDVPASNGYVDGHYIRDNNSNAIIVDKTNHFIQGVLATNGTLSTITYSQQSDFDAAYSNINITTYPTFFTLLKPFSELIVENFDNVFATNTAFPNWLLETVSSSNNTTFKSDSTESVEGPFSAKLAINQSFRVQTTRFFSTVQDWTAYNEISLSVASLNVSHGQLRCQLLYGTSNTSYAVQDDFSLLSINEVNIGFKSVVHDLTSITRDKIIGIRIYTDTGLGWALNTVSFNIDRIILNNNIFYATNGALRFRFSTPQQSNFASISWDADLNSGTIQARARTASSFNVFDQSVISQFSDYINNGENPNVSNNTCIEFEIALTSDSGKTNSPVVRSVILGFVTQSSTSGLSINSYAKFLRAKTLSNILIENAGDVIIDGNIEIGDFYYGLTHSLQQKDSTLVTRRGINGSKFPLSPIQAIRPDLLIKSPEIDYCTTIKRLQDKSYLISDQFNDRILNVNIDGSIIKGLGTNNSLTQIDLYPLSVIYNDTLKLLYIAWSKPILTNSVDLSKFIIVGNGINITLSNSLDKLNALQGSNTSTASSNVSIITLSSSHITELELFLSSEQISTDIYLNVQSNGVVGLNLNSNYSSLSSPKGIQIFVGNFSYVSGIFRPINVSLLQSGNYLISNAKPLLLDSSQNDTLTGMNINNITSTIEIDSVTGEVVFGDNSVNYSTLSLGCSIGYDNGSGNDNLYIACAGIILKNPATVSTTPATTEISALANYIGQISVVEKSSGVAIMNFKSSDGTVFSDLQIDSDQNFIAIERSFNVDGTSRSRIIRIDQNLNIFFQYGEDSFEAFNDVRILNSGEIVTSS